MRIIQKVSAIFLLLTGIIMIVANIAQSTPVGDKLLILAVGIIFIIIGVLVIKRTKKHPISNLTSKSDDQE